MSNVLRSLPLLALLSFPSAACTGSDADVTADSNSVSRDGASRSATHGSTGLLALQVTDNLGDMAREPMIVEAQDGALFVTGYGEDTPRLWRSSDGGARWEPVDVGTVNAGAVGNSDVDLAVAPDGTIHLIAMSYDRAKFEGTGIAVGTSRDGGASWRWTSLSRDRFDDRPWIEVAPDGTAHAIWNDGAGVSHATSADRGATWTERPRITSKGSSSHLAISPTGMIAVRVTPLSASANRFDPGVDHLLVSSDGGNRWETRQLPGVRAWRAFSETEDLLRWVEPVAWDATGALFSLWTEGTLVRLARSTDEGRTWATREVASGREPVYFPYLIARGNGELGLTWFSGLRDSVRANVAYMHFRGGSEEAPVAAPRVEAFAFPSFSRGDTTASPDRDTAGEYVASAFLRDGRLAIVTTIQEQTPDKLRGRYGFTFRPYRIE